MMRSTQWSLLLFAIGFSHAATAQTLTLGDSTDIGRALATYVLAHPDVPLDGTLGRLVVDTTSGTITAFVAAAFRKSAPARWVAPPDFGDGVRLEFNMELALFWGDTVTVLGAWTLCPEGASVGSGRAMNYQVVHADSGWKVIGKKLSLIGRAVCRIAPLQRRGS